MKVVSVASMKGGVGKTSLVANLATALAKRIDPTQILTVDLDPQNALLWHFGFLNHRANGVCAQALTSGNLKDIVLKTPHGSSCLPFGTASEPHRMAFEQLLKTQPDWLARQLATMGLSKTAIVLIDTPPGPSVYLPQAVVASDLMLVALLPDAGSYATVPAMESYLEELVVLNSKLRSAYVVNQTDARVSLKNDLFMSLQHQLQDRLVPVQIHSDESMREALAFQKTVLDYDPQSQAASDVDKLAHWVLKQPSR